MTAPIFYLFQSFNETRYAKAYNKADSFRPSQSNTKRKNQMADHRKTATVLKKGLDLPIAGAPASTLIDEGPAVSEAALVASEYHGLKPKLEVRVGDEVMLGQTLFYDKTYPKVHFTSPASGVVAAVHRGERRALRSIVIRCQGDHRRSFRTWSADDIETAQRDELVDHLCRTGLWTVLRTRPYSRLPDPASQPHSIFVTAMDTRPLAADPVAIIRRAPDAFALGLRALLCLGGGPVFVCLPLAADLELFSHPRLKRAEFAGPHPAGLVGTHIHFLDPVSTDKTVWSIQYQDLMAIGTLLSSGVYPTDRVVSLAGPSIKNARLIRTRLGACISQLCDGELRPGQNRLIAGSVLDGYQAAGQLDYLGRFTLQVTALAEAGPRRILGWLRRGGREMFSFSNALFSNKKRKRDLNCMQYGSERALLPIGLYEEVSPLRILPTPLLRALLVGDTEMAQKLGCLELDEEDLALFSYVCPSKHEFGPILRYNLERIEREG